MTTAVTVFILVMAVWTLGSQIVADRVSEDAEEDPPNHDSLNPEYVQPKDEGTRLGFWAGVGLTVIHTFLTWMLFLQGIIWAGWGVGLIMFMFVIGISAATEYGWNFFKGTVKGFFATIIVGVVLIVVGIGVVGA